MTLFRSILDGEDDTRSKGKAQSSSSTSRDDSFLALQLSADTDSTFKQSTKELDATDTERTNPDAAEVQVKEPVELETQTFEENENDWNDDDDDVWQLQAEEKGDESDSDKHEVSTGHNVPGVAEEAPDHPVSETVSDRADDNASSGSIRRSPSSSPSGSACSSSSKKSTSHRLYAARGPTDFPGRHSKLRAKAVKKLLPYIRKEFAQYGAPSSSTGLFEKEKRLIVRAGLTKVSYLGQDIFLCASASPSFSNLSVMIRMGGT